MAVLNHPEDHQETLGAGVQQQPQEQEIHPQEAAPQAKPGPQHGKMSDDEKKALDIHNQ
ncbi:MAG: hypothetical protein L6R40_005458, partial [Gallowayella cf. fulva]